ncbi:hypothetical protein V9K92_01170 [Phyllobacterium sp. CCNWLW109]|uniref:hypothetical protein n=1 Tax=Phyllobacterium sp. CCNWLW109 TaxID=3127479 RepID=UPI0030778376
MKSGQSRIELAQELKDQLSQIGDKRIERIPAAIDGVNALADAFPDQYHWRFKTAEAFRAEAEELHRRNATTIDLNALYWRDSLAIIEAHTVMSLWRMIEIAQSAFRALEQDNYIPMSILVRSAFESAIQFVDDARTFAPTLDSLKQIDFETQLVESESLETLLLKSVYGSRMSSSDDIYRSRNILTSIERIAKASKNDPIRYHYEVLCELAHPNFLGRSIYLAEVRKGPCEGDEIRIIAHANGINAPPILYSALWALAWSLEGLQVSVHLVQNSIADFLKAHPGLANKRSDKD